MGGSLAMGWGRRRTPWWVWLLALVGMKSLWSWRQRQVDPAWDAKRRRFGEKLDEAFRVWREPSQDDTPRE